jgi:hypothetical protein
MKITLTEKFSKEKAGQTIEVSNATASDLIKEGKATESGAKEKAPKKGAKVIEMTTEATEVIEAPETESNEIVIE